MRIGFTLACLALIGCASASASTAAAQSTLQIAAFDGNPADPITAASSDDMLRAAELLQNQRALQLTKANGLPDAALKTQARFIEIGDLRLIRVETTVSGRTQVIQIMGVIDGRERNVICLSTDMTQPLDYRASGCEARVINTYLSSTETKPHG